MKRVVAVLVCGLALAGSPACGPKGVATMDASMARAPVWLRASDGGVILADLYGSGAHGVVLAHGARFDKGSWAPQARELARRGFRVLALDFRGYGASFGPGEQDAFTAPLHLDVLAAVRHLRETGSASVSVIGASLGGGAAAAAAAAEPALIDRLVLLGATPEGPSERLTMPKLYIMTREDASGAGPRLPALEAHVAQAPEPKTLIVLEGSAHAQIMFQTGLADRVMREIVRFLEAGSQ